MEYSINQSKSNDLQTFLDKNADLIGLDPDKLDELIVDRLSQYPVQYHSIIDGIQLTRGLLPRPDQIVDCHYALLLKKDQIVRLVCLTCDEVDSVPYLSPLELNSQHLMEYIIDAEATAVLLLSNRDTIDNGFTPNESTHVDDLRDALMLFRVELLDWIVMIPSENSSWLEQCGWDYWEEAVNPGDLAVAGVPII